MADVIVIRRYDDSTVNGKPNGPAVYVHRFWNGETWCHSSTKDPVKATHYESEDEAREISGHAMPYWRDVAFVPLKDAKVLP